MTKIGVVITTMNRPELLEYTLKHFYTYKPSNELVIVVTDDNSSKENYYKNKEACEKYGFNYIYNEERLGIAKNKNKGIDFVKQQGYDYLFLFDDDCFPQKEGWDSCFIEVANNCNIEHSMYLVEAGEVKVTQKEPLYSIYRNCGGYCLFFTKSAMESLKGLNPNFGIYGFEHSELSLRADKAGFTNNLGPYIGVNKASEYLFSIDMDKGWLHRTSPLGDFASVFTSSMEPERVELSKIIEENRKVFEKALKELK